MLNKSDIVFFFLFLLSIVSMKIIIDTDKFYETPVVEEVPTKVVKAVNLKHLQCLATGIYYEARGEPFLGQVAVARVIMNRVLHGFAKDPCRVVYQTTTTRDEDDNPVKVCQFSWHCQGKTTPQENNPRYQQALSIAKQVLEEDKWNDILPNNVLFFHNLQVAPQWVYKRVTTIGNHVFYSKGRERQIVQKD